jgi:hypothetical protein
MHFQLQLWSTFFGGKVRATYRSSTIDAPAARNSSLNASIRSGNIATCTTIVARFPSMLQPHQRHPRSLTASNQEPNSHGRLSHLSRGVSFMSRSVSSLDISRTRDFNQVGRTVRHSSSPGHCSGLEQATNRTTIRTRSTTSSIAYSEVRSNDQGFAGMVTSWLLVSKRSTSVSVAIPARPLLGGVQQLVEVHLR